MSKIISNIKNSSNAEYFASSINKYLDLANGNASKLNGLKEVISQAKQMTGSNFVQTERFLNQTFSDADNLVLKGKEVFFEPLEFGTAVDIATKSNNAFDAVYQLKATNISKVTENINKAVGVLKPIQTNAKKIVNVWVEDASKIDFMPKINTIKSVHQNSGVEIYIRFGSETNYSNLFTLQ